ncbi:hypothetical protein Pint_31582 [Pistacia integerrima]|uniref:Uncharacterized protein n=1 Tax=Pistacia integerrima TaxID=434235 RepID=A0ACC0XNT9_9ROSI|nr:hypothetical protein Pint_31582 [Pistacia integerrima]
MEQEIENLSKDKQELPEKFSPSEGAGPPPVADFKSLTHYGEPYDGNSTSFFRSILFVAVVRSCYRESCLWCGMDAF